MYMLMYMRNHMYMYMHMYAYVHIQVTAVECLALCCTFAGVYLMLA